MYVRIHMYVYLYLKLRLRRSQNIRPLKVTLSFTVVQTSQLPRFLPFGIWHCVV